MTAANVATWCDSVSKEEEGDKKLLQLARLAEAAERYPDMCTFMKKLVQHKSSKENGKTLEVEERNLLSVAYKNVVGSKRSSWRTLQSGTFTEVPEEMVKKYKEIVEDELKDICRDVILLLGPDLAGTQESLKVAADEAAKKVIMDKISDESLLKICAGDDESKRDHETYVFYLKMVGDYCRYLAEINDDIAKAYTDHYYNKAYEVAEGSLPETHPTRLGLALNYSVCYYEILKKPDKACKLAKEAFDGAIEKLDTLNDESYKDSTLIMQLLRDNLTLWTSEKEDPAGDGADKDENP